MNTYQTSYGNSYGYNERSGREFNQSSMTRTYFNPQMETRRQASTLANSARDIAQDGGVFFNQTQPMQPTDRSYNAAPATVRAQEQYGNSEGLPTNYDYLGHYEPELGRNFSVREGRWPEKAAVPNKVDFFPSGVRVSYAKGRRTYAKTANLIGMPKPDPQIQFPPMTATQQESASNFGKLSISRRLPEQSVRRYHVPGYMGFVRDQQYHHGRSYGRITRECLMKEYL
jgi:hypothetical protein